MQRKYCGGANYRKNGHLGGFQHYNCKICKRNGTLSKARGYRATIQFQPLKCYLEGWGFRSIGLF